MGTNVIQLADYQVPSYRRRRRAGPASPASAAAPASWSAMARARAAGRRSSAPGAAPAAHHATGSVRVLRAREAVNVTQAGARLRISGRLIDVCAELERLAAAEAASPGLPRRA